MYPVRKPSYLIKRKHKKLTTQTTLPFRNLNFLRKSAPTKESQRYRRSPLKNTPSQLTLTECGRELM